MNEVGTENPYATPSADLTPAANLKKRRVVIMLLLVIVTAGFYAPIWFLLSRQRLNSLTSNEKLAVWPFVVIILLHTASLVTGEADPATGAELRSNLLSLAGSIGILLQSFKVRRILEDHLQASQTELSGVLSGVQRARSALSGVAVFFLTIFYLQYVINKRVAYAVG